MSSEHARLLADARRAAAKAIEAAQGLRCCCFDDDLEYTGRCIKHAVIDPLAVVVAAAVEAAA